MKRPWHVWMSFSVCLVVVLAAMGWVSLIAIRAESDRRRQTTLEDNVRLALWRMDSALAPLVAQEGARPYGAYAAFYSPGLLGSAPTKGKRQNGNLVPSVLLTDTPRYIVLHFQIGPDGGFSSPQVPSAELIELARSLPLHLAPESIATGQGRLAEIQEFVDRQQLIAQLPDPPEAPRELPRTASRPAATLYRARPSQQRGNPYSQQAAQVEQQQQQAVPPQQANRGRGGQEFDQRSQALVFNTQSYFDNFSQGLLMGEQPTGVGLMTPLWIDGKLLLARRVEISGQQVVQGCLLDWPELQSWLLASVADLLPKAELKPMLPSALPDESRLLAALPVRLEAGPIAELPDQLPSSLFLPLAVAWSGVLLAALAVAALLLGVMRLSERRGAFVSAVTHELRTPLTTFRMYAEMLADDMVPDADQRRKYLETLRLEADRLSHLVENVLSYARLERTNTQARITEIPVAQLLDRVRQRLTERATLAGMELAVEMADGSDKCTARTDVSAVEQILFNLVDNACKYATGSDPPTIHLVVQPVQAAVVISVRDHGRGISAQEGRRLFRPFSKTANEAANTAPGVGLGLALSRRLARETGGDLRLGETGGRGACFVLTLPRA